jgi:hypothetical protein
MPEAAARIPEGFKAVLGRDEGLYLVSEGIAAEELRRERRPRAQQAGREREHPHPGLEVLGAQAHERLVEIGRHFIPHPLAALERRNHVRAVHVVTRPEHGQQLLGRARERRPLAQRPAIGPLLEPNRA